jgi:hypothetical protein
MKKVLDDIQKKLHCSSITQFADILGCARKTIYDLAANKTTSQNVRRHKITKRLLQIVNILSGEMTEEQLIKTSVKIHLLAGNEKGGDAISRMLLDKHGR